MDFELNVLAIKACIIFLQIHLDNWSLALKLTNFNFRIVEISRLIVCIVEETTSKCGVTNSGNVSDLRR